MKSLFNRQQPEKGMALLEVLTALGLILPTLLVSLYVLIATQQMSQEARQRLLALNAIRSALETIKGTPLQSVPNINTGGLIPAELSNGVITIATNPVNLIGQSVATVTVTVTWNGPKNIPKMLRVSTMRSKY